MRVDFITNEVWTNLMELGLLHLQDVVTGPFPNLLKEILVLDPTGKIIRVVRVIRPLKETQNPLEGINKT